MADMGQMTRALKRAHEAGDTQGASKIASAIRQMMAGQNGGNPRVDPATNQPAGVPEYSPPGVEGYDPQTGEVARQPRSMPASFIHGAADTATFGFGDELASYPASIMSGRPRGEVLSEMRNLQTEARTDNPGSYLTGQVAGGIAQGVAMAPLSVTAQATTRATPLIGRALAGMADGAVAGGLYGAGSGTDASSRGSEALWGAGIGGVAGGLFPVASDLVGRGVRAVRNQTQVGRIAKEAGADPDSLRLLGKVMDADGSTGPRGQANMTRAGKEAMLVDAGPNARQILDYSIQRGGPGTVVAQDAVSQRVARDAKFLGQVLDNTLGTPQGIGTAQNKIRDAARPHVSQAYERAYQTPIDYAAPAGKKVEEIINRMPPRMVRAAIEKGNERMRWDGLPEQIMADIADDGSVSFRQMPGVLQADYLKRGLDRIVNEGIDPVTGKLSPDAGFAQDMARTLRKAIGEAAPAYRVALETAADPLSQQSAVGLGARLNAMTRDEFARAVEGMTKPEQQAVLQGFRSRIDDQMAAVTRAITDGDMDAREAIKGLKELSSRRVQENIRAVMPKGKADNLFKTIDRITSSFEIRASIADNSKTASRLAAERMVDGKTGLGVVGKAARGEGIKAGQQAIQGMTGYTDDYLRGLQDQTYADLARLLTRTGGAGQDVYSAIGKLGQTDHATELMANRISGLLSAPRLAYPTNALLQEYRRE